MTIQFEDLIKNNATQDNISWLEHGKPERKKEKYEDLTMADLKKFKNKINQLDMSKQQTRRSGKIET